MEGDETGRQKNSNLSSSVIKFLYAAWAWQMFNSDFFFLRSFCGFSTGSTVKSSFPFTCLDQLFFPQHISLRIPSTQILYFRVYMVSSSDLLEMILTVPHHLFHSHLHVWTMGNVYHFLTVSGIEVDFQVHLSLQLPQAPSARLSPMDFFKG